MLNTANKTSSCAVTPSSAARSEPGLPTWAAWTRLKSVVPAGLPGANKEKISESQTKAGNQRKFENLEI